MIAALAHQRGMTHTTLSVTGMSCKSCVARIDRAVRALAGISSVEVELRNGLVHIQHAPNVLASQLIERVQAAGYPSQLVANDGAA
jgi:copper chaperone CopZ